MRTFCLILYCLLVVNAKAQLKGEPAFKVELQTIQGTKQLFSDSGRICVIVFLSPTCPLSQKYTLTLNELAKAFVDTAKFYGVFAEEKPVAGEYAAFKKKYSIRFTLLQDRKKKLVKVLGATVTPEAFVISKGTVIYHGAIDDWAIALGKTKNSATTNFVSNAIRCAIADVSPVPNYQNPVGCFID